jgi:hypothetical protein
MPFNISTDLKTQKNKLEQKDSWIYLLELQLPEGYYRITNHISAVTWNSYTWIPFPLIIGEFKFSSKGEIPSAQISVGNAGGILMNYLRQNKGLSGMQGNIYMVNLAFLNDPIYSVIPEKFTIVGATAQKTVITFTLSIMVDAYNIEGPIQSYDRTRFPALPITQPKYSVGTI